MGDKRDPTLPVRFHKYLKSSQLKRTVANTQKTQLNQKVALSVKRTTKFSGTDGNMQINRKDDNDVTGQLTKSGAVTPCTEDEMYQAIQWVYSQIKIMKEDDNILTQQFLDLRARIRKLKSQLYEPTSAELDSPQFFRDIAASQPNIHIMTTEESDSDSCSMDMSLSPHKSEDYLSEFRGRTVSMVPPKTSVTKVRTIKKYKTEGFL